MTDINTFYDKKSIAKNLIWLALLCILCKTTKGIAFAVLIPIALAFVMQARNTALLFVIFLSAAAMTINPFFMPHTMVFAVSQKVLMLMASVFLSLQIFGRRHSGLITPLLSLVPYLVYMAVVSQSGWSPVISNLKLVLFTMIYFAFYGCAVRVIEDRSDERKVRAMILTLAVFYILGSFVLLLAFPGISYMSPDEILENPGAISLFMGATNHSQALGPTMAMFSVILFADLMFSIQKPDRLYVALLLLVPLLIYKTSSRTAMGSYVAGMAFVTFFAMRSRGIIKTRWRLAVTNFMLMAAVFGAISISVVPPLRDKATRFLVKNYSGETVVSKETILASRTAVLEGTLANWRRSPVIGNGFQVSDRMQGVKVDSIRDMLTAPVEKSTWTYAILEEGGVIGMVLFSVFLLTALGQMVRRQAYIGASMLFTFVMVNFGEFGMFSMSAEGGLFWCMVFVGVILDYKRYIAIRQREEQAAFERSMQFGEPVMFGPPA